MSKSPFFSPGFSLTPVRKGQYAPWYTGAKFAAGLIPAGAAAFAAGNVEQFDVNYNERGWILQEDGI